MQALPFVSVCLLTYKRAQQLPQTIESLLAQTHRDLELIINDDNSPDETEDVCRKYEERDSRVRYYRNPRNVRYAGNQNYAIERARSDYVAIVHDGDIYRADLIEKWTRALVAHPSAAIVFNALETMDLNGVVQGVHRHPYGPIVPGRTLLDDMLQRPDSPIYGIVMVRRSKVQAAGQFDHRLPTLADVDMWLRLLTRNDAAYIAEPLIRIAARETDHHNYAGNWKVRAQYALIYRLNFFRRYPVPSSEGEVVRHKINRMLSWQKWRQLAWCLKRMRWRDFASGLRYILSDTEYLKWSDPAHLKQ